MDSLQSMKPPSEWEACSDCGEQFATDTLRDGRCPVCHFRIHAKRREDAKWLELLAKPQQIVEGRVPYRYVTAANVSMPPGVDLDGDHWSITIQGPNGRGKSWAAVRVLVEIALNRRVKDFLWINCVTVAADLRHEIQNNESGVILHRMRRVPILVLDDLGAIRQTEFLAEQMRIAICDRYENQRITIVTTDVPISEYEDRIESRLRSGLVVPLKGKDRRIQP